MRRIASLSYLAFLVCSPAHARDGFEKVRCEGDIAKALIGQRGSNEPVVAIEARHKDLSLKDMGASDYGKFSSIVWQICGGDYMLLEDNRSSLIHDALRLPPHSKSNPFFEGPCKRDGKLLAETLVGVLRDEAGHDELAAEAAWIVDEKATRFVKAPVESLLCARNGIIEQK